MRGPTGGGRSVYFYAPGGRPVPHAFATSEAKGLVGRERLCRIVGPLPPATQKKKPLQKYPITLRSALFGERNHNRLAGTSALRFIKAM